VDELDRKRTHILNKIARTLNSAVFFDIERIK
jgi:hypothetical protein